MIPELLSVDFARIQFALTASFHFLFVPLTLGLTWILFTMESMYVKTGKQVYKDMTKFWGKLFGINFALGVLTGITMEFEFGTNWAYYSQFVGDIFGTPLAIEGLAAFMLESAFVGMFFFGWDRLSKKQHLLATFCLAIGSSLSALLILVANGYMQNPVGGIFVWENMRMETVSLLQLFMSETAQLGFTHVILAGYATASIFVIGVSAFYILHGRDMAFAKRSMAIGLGFGIVVTSMLLYIGDDLGRDVYKKQPLKLAMMEGEWETQKTPAAWTLIAFPDQKEQENHLSFQIPYVLTYLITHTGDTPIYGIKDILYNGYKMADGTPRLSMMEEAKKGIVAYDAMIKLRRGDKSQETVDIYEANKQHLGFGMLLIPYAFEKNKKISELTEEEIRYAVTDSIPNVASIFWSFRVMVGMGLLMLLTMILGIVLLLKDKLVQNKFVLRLMVYSIPAPWIACLCGWFITEHGRQPWTVYEVLPTSLSASTISALDVFITMILFLLIDLTLFIIEIFLMFKYARLGPSSLHTGKYHFEKQAKISENK